MLRVLFDEETHLKEMSVQMSVYRGGDELSFRFVSVYSEDHVNIVSILISLT